MSADLLRETWVPIQGYEGRYQVSDLGHIWSDVTGTLMKTAAGSHGYPTVKFRKNGEYATFCVHRVVADHFVEHPAGNDVVCHNDGVRTNNAATNLRWGTPSDNMQDSIRHGTHVNTNKTACKHGHPYLPNNLMVDGRGRRDSVLCCTVCRRGCGTSSLRRLLHCKRVAHKARLSD